MKEVMNTSIYTRLCHVLGKERVVTDAVSRKRLSKDFYWYSPILSEQLDEKVADYVVFPHTEAEVKAIIAIAVQQRVPVTVRGSGTGNYGQIVPMLGGILIDMTKMGRIIEIKQGEVRVEAGTKMGLIERELREQGQELCIYPSTYMKATAGGFVAGGSGGIGSITWGNLWDGNVIELKVVTVEETPRVINARGTDLMKYIHSYGTTGIITEVVFRTTTRVDWMEAIASFGNLDDHIRFAKQLAEDSGVMKRSISTCEWPIPSYFRTLKHVIRDGEHIVFLEFAEQNYQTVEELVKQHGGVITYVIPADKYHLLQSLSNFTWNHTTLWALKANEKMTYLQGSFQPNNILEQVHRIKEKFKDEFYVHFDLFRDGGKLITQSIPLIRFSTKERLEEMMAFCESVGVKIFNPHTVLLEEGGWEKYIYAVLQTKQNNDPYGLLNPGKIGVSLPA